MSVVVPSTVTSLYDLATELLEAIVAAMATTEAGAPPMQYIALGAPAFGPESCDQAVVGEIALSEGNTSPTQPSEITGQRFRYGRLNVANMTAYAMRCMFVSQQNQVPYAGLTVADLDAASSQGYQDMWAIWNYVNYAIRNGTLFGGTCSIVHFRAAPSYTPEAGLGGSKFTVGIQLDGYDATQPPAI